MDRILVLLGSGAGVVPHTVVRCCVRTFLAAMLALPVAARSQSQTNTQDTFHIHGVVLDSHTGKPISRVVVEAYNGRLATFTDHDGRFALTLHFTPVDGQNVVSLQRSLLNSGYLYLGLTVLKPGYSQPATQRQLQQVAVSALDNDLVIKLDPESTLQGRISTLADDHPEGIRVSLFTRRIQNGSPVWGSSSVAVTDSRGEFRFAGLQPGRYRLLTQDWSDQPGQANIPSLAESGRSVVRYPPISYPAAEQGADGGSISLAAGEVEQVSLNLHPRTYVPVRIPIALPEGSNGGLQVRIQRSGDTEIGQSGLTLRYVPREKVVQGLLPAGQYQVTLQTNNLGGPPAAGSAAVVQLTVGGSRVETSPVTLQPMPSIPVIVHQDLTRSSPAVSAPASSAVAGRARTRSELSSGVIAGVAGHGDYSSSPVQILLIPSPGTSQAVIAHRRSGSEDIVLEPVPPGTYRMELNAPGGYIAAAISGGTDLLRDPLIVTPGSSVAPIEITVRDDTATLRGTLDSALLGAANATSTATNPGFDLGNFDPSHVILITCIPSQPNGQHLTQVLARPDGSFTFPSLAPGSYRVYASRVPLESLEYRSESFTREYGAKSQSVTLEPNGNATVTLTSVIEEIKDP